LKEVVRMIDDGFFKKESFKDRNDYFRKTSEFLLEKDYVKESFEEAIVAREEKFPTGLRTLGGIVSIPHTEADHVLKEAIIVTIFENPVEFISMEDMKTILPVDISFMLLVSEPSKHLECLQQLISVVSNINFQSLKTIKNKEEFISMIKQINIKVG